MSGVRITELSRQGDDGAVATGNTGGSNRHRSQYPRCRQWCSLVLGLLMVTLAGTPARSEEWRAALRFGGGRGWPVGAWYEGMDAAAMGGASVAIAVPRRNLAGRLSVNRGGLQPGPEFQLLAGRTPFTLTLWRAVLSLDLLGAAPGPGDAQWTATVGGGRSFHSVTPPVGGDVLPGSQRSPLGGSDSPALWTFRLGLRYAVGLSHGLGLELSVDYDQMAARADATETEEGGGAALFQVSLGVVWWFR